MTQEYTRVWQNGRLLYFSSKGEPGYWHSHWNGVVSGDYYEKYERGALDELSPFVERVFSKEDRILEAGCGAARFVVALRSRGFRSVDGLDCGPETVARVKAHFPSLPVRVGDAMNIDRQDGYYDGYISLGVVEHRMEGPEPFLREAWRVLKAGGHALFSVPYVNPLRGLKHRIGLFGRVPRRAPIFYQYAFTKNEFARMLTQTGFDVMETRGVAGYYALEQELPALLGLLRSIPGGWRVQSHLKSSRWVDYFGHMILFVCRKRAVRDCIP